MPKAVVVSLNGVVSSFQLSKVERSKLYGSRRRLAVDSDGRTCTRAALTDDGRVLLRAGMTAQGWFDSDGRQIERKDIGAEDADGNQLQLVPSTLGTEQAIVGPIDPREILDLSVTAVYQLIPDQLDDGLAAALLGGSFYRFAFNYRPDYRCETGYLIQNNEGVFAVIGTPAPAQFLETNAAPPEDFDDENDDTELDFEMF